MHTFIDNIITFSLRNKFFIFFCTTIAVIAGITSFIHTPIDAFPDVTNTKVTIITQWPGRSAEEIEKFITIPIEIAMNPVQKKTDIRSTTLFGLSVINVMFEDKVDDFFARQQVYNLLNDADLPEGVTPEVGGLSGGSSSLIANRPTERWHGRDRFLQHRVPCGYISRERVGKRTLESGPDREDARGSGDLSGRGF